MSGKDRGRDSCHWRGGGDKEVEEMGRRRKEKAGRVGERKQTVWEGRREEGVPVEGGREGGGNVKTAFALPHT